MATRTLRRYDSFAPVHLQSELARNMPLNYRAGEQSKTVLALKVSDLVLSYAVRKVPTDFEGKIERFTRSLQRP